MKHQLSLQLAAIFAITCGVIVASSARADSLDQKLLQQAPRVMDRLQQKGYRHVGVLTFRFQDDPQKTPVFRGTAINANMADRVERALVMAFDPERPVYILADARRTAASRIPGATYRTANDRRRLFDLKYPLPVATGERFAAADAFITGKVSLSKNLAKTTVEIEMFDRAKPETVTPLLSFEVDTDGMMLADAGRGYSLSRHWGRFSRGEMTAKDIWDTAAQESLGAGGNQTAKDASGPTVGGGSTFPIALSVLYDGVAQQLTDDPISGFGTWRMVDPRAGQQVVFDVRNTTSDKLAMVLTLDGVNTLYEETGDPSQMARWILEPGKVYRIRGFYQADMQTVRPLQGMSDEDTALRMTELAGAARAGIIHVYVFRPAPVGSAGNEFAMARGGSLRPISPRQLGLKGPPRDWNDYRTRVALGMKYKGARGLIGTAPGSELEPIQLTEFEAPFMSDTIAIRYFSVTQ